MQNGYIERFNRVYREAILDAYLFTDIRDSEPSPKNGSKNTTNEDPMKHYRTEHPPNGNNKFNLNLTIKPAWKKGYLQEPPPKIRSKSIINEDLTNHYKPNTHRMETVNFILT